MNINEKKVNTGRKNSLFNGVPEQLDIRYNKSDPQPKAGGLEEKKAQKLKIY